MGAEMAQAYASPERSPRTQQADNGLGTISFCWLVFVQDSLYL